MSDAIKPGKPRRLRVGLTGRFSDSGRAGPRRLVIIAVVGVSVIGLVVTLTLGGRHKPQFSFDARMKPVDALPGGLHSTPEQDALADRADTAQAQAAQRRGTSYTPPTAPSVAFQAAVPEPEQPAPAAAAPPPQPRFVGRPAQIYPASVVVPPLAFRPSPAVATAPPPVVPVAQQQQQQPQQLTDAQQQQLNQQVKDLFSQWGGRAPKTDVVLPPTDPAQNVSAEESADPPSSGSRTRRAADDSSDQLNSRHDGQVLIPAGRGIYAHPVLALSADQSSPAVFQADSGPIAGDRMIGSFSRQANRLIVRISTIIHLGQAIGADALVIAPDTLEASVASGVDQHYLERFALPAAAAFVQGLGQAIATTSNTTAVLSPLGGATTTTSLNFPQQLGVAAGAAASNIGSTLNQAAPKGPTITLDANVSVGVMFLSNVTYEPRGQVVP
jgi:intracellular multiplication protein IcmE